MLAHLDQATGNVACGGNTGTADHFTAAGANISIFSRNSRWPSALRIGCNSKAAACPTSHQPPSCWLDISLRLRMAAQCTCAAFRTQTARRRWWQWMTNQSSEASRKQPRRQAVNHHLNNFMYFSIAGPLRVLCATVDRIHVVLRHAHKPPCC